MIADVRARRRERALAIAATLVAVLASCDRPPTADGEAPGVATRDSAGVRIIEHHGAAPAHWTAREVVRVGAADGPESETFHQIADIEIVGDRIYVLDSGDFRVKAYDRSGAYVLGFGREGEGPADFRGPTQLMARGDTLTVFDYRLGKLASFDADGELLSTFRPQFQQDGVFSPSGMEPMDGGFVAWSFPGFCRLPPPTERDLTWRLFRVDRAGGRPDTLIVAPGRSMVAIYLAEPAQCTVVPRVGGRYPQVAVSPSGDVAYGDGDDYEVLVFRPDGDAARPSTPGTDADQEPPSSGVRLSRVPDAILRRFVELRPVTDAEREENRRTVLDREGPGRMQPAMRRAAARALDSVPAFDTWPAFDGLAWDGEGRLWVRRTGSLEEMTRTWDVYDEEGTLIAESVLPARVQVRAIEADDANHGATVWGVEMTSLGVQQLVAYEVGRGSDS